MVPSLPFVLISGKIDLPRTGNKNITLELIKCGKICQFRVANRTKNISNVKTQGFNQLFPKANHFKWTATQICVNMLISAFVLRLLHHPKKKTTES